ncbi:MAG: vWA domain-containing protein, partial [Chthoniobacterales bacterium]
MNFGTPQWFWVLVALPLLALLFMQAERRASLRLAQFVSPRLLPDLVAAVDRFRRGIRFGLLLGTFACAVVALARPQWGYTFEDVKRKGLDLIFAVDTSRSMLSNDVQPNRLQRVRLSAQDLVNELQGDRVGLIAFAGRAFVQAPLTIDYEAAADSINDLDTNTIPEGGTNISEAINLAVQTFGKSAIGNRALIIFTDGEELSGDSAKTAKAAADAGVRIFTIGVGTPEGSLIPIIGEGGGTAFVKDSKGQVVKSKLDEKRLREAAEATGGFYLHLEDGPRTMKKLFADGLGKMQAGDIDARLSRRPIERYQWPLGIAFLALIGSLLVSERKRSRGKVRVHRTESALIAAAASLLLSCSTMFGAAPGLDAYRNEKFGEAYEQFQRALKEHPEARAADKILFDAGAAAYKMQDYGKALDTFSQALLSPNRSLQTQSHYNLGNTLYERGEKQTADDKKLSDWNNALQHYDQTLKFEPNNKEAKDNYEFVKKKIEELKNKQQQATPTPPPSPSPKPQDKNEKQKQDQKKDQQQNSPNKPDEQKQDKQEKNQDQQKQDQEKEEKNEPDQSKSGDKEKPE